MYNKLYYIYISPNKKKKNNKITDGRIAFQGYCFDHFDTLDLYPKNSYGDTMVQISENSDESDNLTHSALTLEAISNKLYIFYHTFHNNTYLRYWK